jgi:hypothetical protein
LPRVDVALLTLASTLSQRECMHNIKRRANAGINILL